MKKGQHAKIRKSALPSQKGLCLLYMLGNGLHLTSQMIILLLQEGLMRKRIACINEAPIQPHERRIAVDDDKVVHNAWLTEQGLAERHGSAFPLSGGASTCY